MTANNRTFFSPVELTSPCEYSVKEGETESIKVCLTVTKVAQSLIHRVFPIEVTPFGSAKSELCNILESCDVCKRVSAGMEHCTLSAGMDSCSVSV